MANSTKLSLPLVAASQAQKHVTVNETFLALDIIVQLNVLDRNLAAPPGSPAEGDAYIVAAAASGAWAGKSNQVAAYQGGGWVFHVPREGWNAWVRDENVPLVYDGTNWSSLIATGGGLTVASLNDGSTVTLLGINGATADTTNRLSINTPASLFNHGGAGHQMKVNKSAAIDTGSLLFQTGFSGRTEVGLIGSDDFSMKVSPDGSAWTEALRISRTTGIVSGTAVQSGPADVTTGRLMPVGAFGLGRNSAIAVTQLNDLAANGFYSITAANAVAGNAPTGNSYTVLHEQYDANAAIQLAWQASGSTEPRLWQRVKVSSTWQAWTLTYTRANVLGSVSQASGLPTGALIESDSNANGFYTRFASGLQICRVSLAASAAAGVTWTFPATFSAAPVITGTAVATVLSAVCLDAAPGTTTATFSARDKTDARRADTCHLTAVGRWF